MFEIQVVVLIIFEICNILFRKNREERVGILFKLLIEAFIFV